MVVNAKVFLNYSGFKRLGIKRNEFNFGANLNI